ncbi:hypothetical protein A3B45_04070 [Candidatus Daviesbacteria bacterium RIFCSPLOWO2_01_FULL_39_12]|uniref:RND efflux pump membrane fusion protein barrel-sandwich domain-containing protein n=1 Tax=Candidatus Daviesbacteria bacterium RIFCSPLOWO2_01_FULL_39_12 TaxID=1797785 RepID=A0A1F5KSE6_9BACT|nr:MAG: hypothetical protein A3D79_01095 [Candidatus Daviesbacteria bacterium RIFCSPHIGHO2_02_FULL_39_8]OGE43754.1 MAG: hypothetical protein A3B45_04070 [Candidatus Daviesbacteria bacterium RIFCSPLOWO2_01_FULL_39_12]
MRIPKKIFVIGLIALVAISVFVFFQRSAPKQPEFTTVQKADIKQTVSISGSLAGQSSIDLKFPKGGKITSISVSEGDTVYEGQTLAALENTNEMITLQQADNTLRDKQAAVDKVLDDIHLSQYGMGGFDNVGSGNETMAQRQLRTAAEVTRDNAFDSLKLAQKALNDTLIISPTSGIVVQVNHVTGQVIGATEVVMKMVDTSNIYFSAEVDEADISKISLGQKTEVTLDAYPDKIWQGEVVEVQPQTKTTSTGATVVSVKIKLDRWDLNFINGLSGQASIILSEVKNTLTIPTEALRDDNTVLVLSDGRAKSKQIVPGIRSDQAVEIKEGLEENETIIIGKAF